MNFQLETERLKLRDMREDDIPVLVKLFAEPESKRQILSYQSDEARNAVDLKNAIAWTEIKDRLYYGLTVQRKNDGVIIGNCSLSKVQRESYATHIGWHYGVEYQDNGYATEAARALVGFGFETKGVAAIYADCFDDNLKSISVIKKLGMTPQWNLDVFNLLRGLSYGELFRRTIRHSITREDWLAKQNNSKN